MDNAFQHSTIAQIIENILEQFTFEGESRSNIADILLSILNKTEYNEDPHSVIGDLLIRLKAKIEGESYDPYDAAYTSRIAEILISILEDTEYTEEPQSRIAELLLQLKEELGDYTELTASGSVASFITNVVKPLVNGEFTIQAYQEGSGDPAPDNVRNIIPFNTQKIIKAGKNLLDKRLLVQSSASSQPFLCKIGVDNFLANIPNGSIVLASGRYTFSCIYKNDSSKNNTQLSVYDENGNNLYTRYTVQSIKFTVPKPMAVCFYINCGASGFTSWDDYDIQLEVGSQATDYEQYNGEIKTVALGQDVYGGSYNSVTGKMVNNVGLKTFVGADSEGWAMPASQSYVSANIIDMLASSGYKGLCNYIPVINTIGNGITIGANSKRVYVGAQFLSSINVSTLEDWKTYLADHNLIVTYPLATPIETDLDPTLIETYDGSNNIFCDTGDSSVTYLYKGTPPATLNRVLSKSPDVEDIIKEEELGDLKDLDELQDPDISDKEVK